MPAVEESLLSLLEAPMAAVASTDLGDAAGARRRLQAAFPFEGTEAASLRGALLAAVEEGSVCHRGEEPMRFSRLVKPDATVHGVSVDVVWMSGAGPRHGHPRGEANLCFAVEGKPRFDGHEEGWVVLEAGSVHVPTVSGGRMLIVYFLPGGELDWLKDG